MIHPGRLIMNINVVQNDISDNFYFDHKAVQSNLTELFFEDLMMVPDGTLIVPVVLKLPL